MTSAKFSDKTFRFTFFRTMQKNWYFPALIMLVVSFITFLSGLGNEWFNHIDRFGGLKEQGLSFSSFVNDYHFILGSSAMRSEMYMAFMMLLAMATGIMIFRYMFSKKAVNVYYSLGISRRNMFLSKYLSGVTMFALSVLIPLAVDVVINIAVFGFSEKLLITALFWFFGTFISLVFAYSVSIAVCCRVGTIIEAIVYSGVFLITPVFLSYIAEFLFTYFLYGSPISEAEWIYNWSNGLAYGDGSFYHVMLYFAYNTMPFVNYFIFSYELHKTLSDWVTPDFAMFIPLLILTIAVSIIALLTYKKRKTEIAGFLGCDELIKGVSVFVISSAVVAFIIKELIEYTPDIAVFCICLTAIVFFIVYIFFEIITLHNIKRIVKSSWKYFVHLSAIVLIIVLFTSGLFGYSSRIPDAEDVESVSVTTGTGDVMMNYNELGMMKNYSGLDFADYYFLAGISFQGIVDGFTQPEDIEYITDIHEKFIDCKKLEVNHETLNAGYRKRVLPVSIDFRYKLKNGDVVERRYTVATDEIMQMLAELTETERYKELATEYIRKPVPEMMYNETFDEYYYSSNEIYDSGISTVTKEEVAGYAFSSERPFTFRGADVAIASPLFSNITYIPSLTEDSETKDNLLNAICKDIENDTLPLNYRTDSKILGYIIFDNFILDNENYDDITVRYQGGSVISRKITEPFKINVFGGEFKACAASRVAVPVYEDMSNTVDFLKTNGLESYLSEASEISKIRIWVPDEQSVADNDTYVCASMLWCGCWYNTDEVFSLIPGNATSITDENDIEKIASYCSMMTLVCYENNYAEVIFEDGSRTFAAIPVK